MATKKAHVIAQSIFDKLKLRLSALAVVAGADTNGNPTIAIGPGTAGGQNAFLRVIDQPTVVNNAIGVAQASYGPHIIQLVVELSTTAGQTLVSLANLSTVLWEVVPVGAKVEIYTTANTTAPTVAGITGTPAVALDDLYWPQLGSM